MPESNGTCKISKVLAFRILRRGECTGKHSRTKHQQSQNTGNKNNSPQIRTHFRIRSVAINNILPQVCLSASGMSFHALDDNPNYSTQHNLRHKSKHFLHLFLLLSNNTPHIQIADYQCQGRDTAGFLHYFLKCCGGSNKLRKHNYVLVRDGNFFWKNRNNKPTDNPAQGENKNFPSKGH